MVNYELRVLLIIESNHKKKNFFLLKNKINKIKYFKAFYWKTNMESALDFLKFHNIEIKNLRLSPGALCIWASYLNMFINFVENSDKDYLISLEDDVILPRKFELIIKKLISNNKIKKIGAFNLNKKKYNLIGTIYYKPYLKNIIELIKKKGIFTAIDVFLLNYNIVKRTKFNYLTYNKNIKSLRINSHKINLKNILNM